MPLKELAEHRSLLHSKSDAQAIVNHALDDLAIGKVGLVSSFGAESVVLLHMVSRKNVDTPVLFLDTEMLFQSTLDYQKEVADHLGLTNVQVITPDRGALLERDVDGILHKFDLDACCALRKTEPLENALKEFGGWITGRKRFQGGTRANLPIYEKSGRRIKINPLANWSPKQAAEYIKTHNLPRHPMVAKGYPSLGCAPCTSKARPDEDQRAGRWRGTKKDECGIHFVDGKTMRKGFAI